jgi:hypothetical protein
MLKKNEVPNKRIDTYFSKPRFACFDPPSPCAALPEDNAEPSPEGGAFRFQQD